jgi:hypothetical protein
MKLSYLTKKKINFYIIVQIITAFIFITVVLNMVLDSKSKVLKLNNAVNDIYKITDDLFDHDERLFFNQSDNVMILKQFYTWLNSQFNYIVLNHQYLSIEESSFPDMFKLGYENGESIPDVYKSIQVNKYFFDFFSVDIDKGRFFEDSDYNISNEVVPILMGNAYKTYTDISDRIQVYYCGKDITCEIAGFLEEGAYFNNGYDIQSLDRYIVMPSLESPTIEPIMDKEQKSFELKVYLDKCNGFISSSDTGSSIQNMITSKCYELDVRPFLVEGVTSFYLTMWGLEGEQLYQLLMVIAIVMLIISIFCISINMAAKVLFLKKDLSIYISNGLRVRDILLALFFEIISCNLISAILGSLVAFLVYGNILLPQLFCIAFTSSCLELVYPAIVLKKLNISKTLRGDY